MMSAFEKTTIQEKEDKKVMAKKEADKKTTLKEDDISDLKIRVSQITNNIRLRQNIPEDITGLLITRVEQNSDAERKGIRPGDIIQEVNQTSVNSIEKLRSIIKTLKGKKKIRRLIIYKYIISFVHLDIFGKITR